MLQVGNSGVTVAGLFAAAFIALLPFIDTSGLFYGAVNAKYFFIVGAVTVAALYLGYLLISGKQTLLFRRRWLLALVGAVLLAHYLAAFAGVYPERSLWGDILRSSGVFFLTYVAFLSWWSSELLDGHDWTVVRRAIALSGALFAALSFLGPEGFDVVGMKGFTIGNSTFAGAYLVLAIIVTLIEFFRSGQGSRWRYALAALLVVQLTSPLLLAGEIWRGHAAFADILDNPLTLAGEARASSVVAFMVVVFAAGLAFIRRYVRQGARRRALPLAWSGVWLAAILILASLLLVPGSPVQDRYVEVDREARIIVWNIGWEAVKERPLLGWGPENFRLAYAQHFDNRLYLEDVSGEVWFDRVHNVVIDSLVSVGVVGFAFMLLLAAYFVYTAQRARRHRIISSMEMYLLGALPIAHFTQLQTSFDTQISYALMGLMVGYGLWLEREVVGRSGRVSASPLPPASAKAVGGAIIALAFLGGWFVGIQEYQRQSALFSVFHSRSGEEQLQLAKEATSQRSDFESLRLASTSFARGVITGGAAPEQQERVREQLNLYIERYQHYVDEAPEDYRARMDYAYLLLIEMFFGGNRAEEAKRIAEGSYTLSPGNPLTHAVHAMAELYSGNPAAARERISEGAALNTDIDFTKAVEAYIEEQIENLPDVAVFQLEHL